MRFWTISQSASQVTLCPAPPKDVTFDKQKLQNHILPPWRRRTVNKNPSPSQVAIRTLCSCVASFFYLFIFKHSFICDISWISSPTNYSPTNLYELIYAENSVGRCVAVLLTWFYLHRQWNQDKGENKYLCNSFVNKKPYVALLSKNKASVYIGVKVKWITFILTRTRDGNSSSFCWTASFGSAQVEEQVLHHLWLLKFCQI